MQIVNVIMINVEVVFVRGELLLMISSLLQMVRHKSLLFKQILFTALAFLLMVVLSYYFTGKIVHNSLTRYAESVFSNAQSRIEYDLKTSEMMLASVCQGIRALIIQRNDVVGLEVLIHDMSEYINENTAYRTGFEDMFVYLETLPQGPVLIGGAKWDMPAGYDVTGRPWYRTAAGANGGEIVTTLPYQSLLTGETIITFVRCLYDDEGRRLGIVGLNARVREIGDDIVNIALAQGGHGMLFSHDLTVIAHANPDFVGLNWRDPALPISVYVDDVLSGKDIIDKPIRNWRGEDMVAFVRELPNGWYLGLLTPKAPFYQSVSNMMIILCALGAALSGVLIIILIRIDRARVKADEESKHKSAFLANMSHEIRTPLNAVIGLSDLVLDSNELNVENRYKLEQIYNSGVTLLNMVNDVLDISKIEAGKFELVTQPYDIPSLINDAVTQSIVHRGDKPIQFVMHIDPDLPVRLTGDELRIKQILTNLLSNAFKYTQEGTVELAILFEREGTAVWLTAVVRDTGIGIKQKDMGVLFDDYIQMDMAANRKIIGTGLGLPIAKRLTELMGGQITADSEYGRGSVFIVRLLQEFVTDDVVGSEVIESLQSLQYSEIKRRRSANRIRLSLPYARVLLVDDVTTNLDVAKGIMKPYNMQIDCVTCGQDAVDAVREEKTRYNAIFMDHMMPGMDGLEATKLIREINTEYAKSVPIIALTANALVGNEEMFLRNGFQAFVSKPIEINRLDAVIRDLVRDKAQEALFNLQNKDEPGEQPDSDGASMINWQIMRDRATELNIEKGLERFGGSGDSYLRVLRSYATNTPELLDSARDIYKDPENYAIVVHGIKGSSRGICADKTADLAETLEKASKAGDYVYVSAHNGVFLETARRLVADIEAMLAANGNDHPQEKRTAPDRKTLEKLREACIQYDMDGVDAAIEELEAFTYETGGELINWLRDSAEQMNFADIIEKLTND